MTEIAGRELCPHPAQEVHELRTTEPAFDLHFPETKDASAAIDRAGLGHSSVLFARTRCLGCPFGARWEWGRSVEVRVLLRRSGVRPCSPRGFRLSKRDGSEEAESEGDEERRAPRSADMTARHFAPAFAVGTGALGGGGATGGGGGSGFIKLR